MSARQRDSLAASGSSESQMTYTRFLQLFPDNDACLDYLKAKFYPDGSACPSCKKTTKFHRLSGRAAYSCQYCRHQIYPTAGTIFDKSTTNLQMWFWAIFLMSSTRCGISAKQLEREIGVSYPTAHRMFKKIRTLLNEDDEPAEGTFEIDEAYYGGKLRLADKKQYKDLEGYEKMQAAYAAGMAKKTPVFGVVQRGGNVSAKVNPTNLHNVVTEHMTSRVLPGSMVYTDEAKKYNRLPKAGYQHKRVHHAQEVYVDGDVSTNTIEGFWALTKNGIRGVYHSVSSEYLQDYLNEYAFRYNRRDGKDPIFWAILDQVRKDDALPA